MTPRVSPPTQIQRFHILGHLGSGGMGSVFRAHDPQLERDVAIKLLAAPERDVQQLSERATVDLRGDAPSRDDLLAEARMMARLSHQNVLPVFEVGLADGAVFVVMEHIAGGSLRDWLCTPRTPAEIVEVFAQAGRGLAAAHARGIVHRDFKPENVLIGDDGRARVADFGLSQLVGRPAGAMIRIDDGRGTPQYMAPELWRGEPATVASDVYAFCAAVTEAFGCASKEPSVVASRLREHVTSRLARAIAAGLAEDPAARPPLATIVAACTRSQPRRLVLASLALVLVVVGGAFAAGRRPGAACELPGDLFLGRWDAGRRIALRTALAAHATLPDDRAAIDELVARLDREQAGVVAAWETACDLAARDELTDAQLHGRQGCLARRAIEVGALVDQLFAAPDRPMWRLAERAVLLPPAGGCEELVAAPLPEDARPTEALYARFVAIDTTLDHRPRAPLIDALDRIAADAARLEDGELEVRALRLAGAVRRQADLFTSADAMFQRSYQRALEIRDANDAALALAARSNLASLRIDVQATASFADLAVDTARDPRVPATTRATAISAQVLADRLLGNTQRAVLRTDQALATAALDGVLLPSLALLTRREKVVSLAMQEGKELAAIALAKDDLELAARTYGEHSIENAAALNALALADRYARDPEAAFAARTRALAVFEELLPPDAPNVIFMRGNVAADYMGRGEFAKARDELAFAVAASEHDEWLRQQRPLWLADLGFARFSLGEIAAGAKLHHQGTLQMIGMQGREHPTSIAYRWRDISIEIQRGALDDADRDIAELQADLSGRRDAAQKLAGIRGELMSAVALQRHHYADAARLALDAAHTWKELSGPPGPRGYFLSFGCDALAELHRLDESRAAIAEAADAIKLSKTSQPDDFAELDICRAKVAAAAGHRAEARRIAERALAVFDNYPGDLSDRKKTLAILARVR